MIKWRERKIKKKAFHQCKKEYERCLKSGYYGNKDSWLLSFHWKIYRFFCAPRRFKQNIYIKNFFSHPTYIECCSQTWNSFTRELIGRFNFWFTRSGGRKADLRIDDKKYFHVYVHVYDSVLLSAFGGYVDFKSLIMKKMRVEMAKKCVVK